MENRSKTINPLPKSKNLVLALSPGASEKCLFLNQVCVGINIRPNRLSQQETCFEKTNIMPLTESIMLFYREAFPLSYQFAGCALIWQLWKSPVQ